MPAWRFQVGGVLAHIARPPPRPLATQMSSSAYAKRKKGPSPLRASSFLQCHTTQSYEAACSPPEQMEPAGSLAAIRDNKQEHIPASLAGQPSAASRGKYVARYSGGCGLCSDLGLGLVQAQLPYCVHCRLLCLKHSAVAMGTTRCQITAK